MRSGSRRTGAEERGAKASVELWLRPQPSKAVLLSSRTRKLIIIMDALAEGHWPFRVELCKIYSDDYRGLCDEMSAITRHVPIRKFFSELHA